MHSCTRPVRSRWIRWPQPARFAKDTTRRPALARSPPPTPLVLYSRKRTLLYLQGNLFSFALSVAVHNLWWLSERSSWDLRELSPFIIFQIFKFKVTLTVTVQALKLFYVTHSSIWSSINHPRRTTWSSLSLESNWSTLTISKTFQTFEFLQLSLSSFST